MTTPNKQEILKRAYGMYIPSAISVNMVSKQKLQTNN